MHSNNLYKFLKTIKYTTTPILVNNGEGNSEIRSRKGCLGRFRPIVTAESVIRVYGTT